MASTSPPGSIDAKLVVLGSQGVGKTSLVHRYVKNAFIPPNRAQSTVGANFSSSYLTDPESGTTIRLQIWDTAGQERFRSISRLYYRGAHAAILCYDVTSRKSFEDMGAWLKELKDNCGPDIIVHVVGTKADIVASEPKKREVPFEKCLGYVAEHLYPGIATPSPQGLAHGSPPISMGVSAPPLVSPNSNRSSGFWGQETIFDACHEVSAKDAEGIDEVFRVITRKLVEQQSRKLEALKMAEGMQSGRTPGLDGGGGIQGYFDLPHGGTGSFRVGYGDKRRSWLGQLTPGALTNYSDDVHADVAKGGKRGRCC